MVWGYFGLIRKVTALPPIAYASFYVLMIPTFAFVYWFFLADSFYAPYSRLEAAAGSDVDGVLELIDQAVQRRVEGKRIIIAGRNLKLFRLGGASSPEGSRLYIRTMSLLSGRNADDNDRPLFIYFTIFIASRPEGWMYFERPMNNPNDPFEDAITVWPVYIDRQLDLGEMSPIAEEIFENAFPVPEQIRSYGIYKNTGALQLTNQERTRLEALFRGLEGNPMRISESFWRMAYFSTTVITTIGFGDIVPMTPIARLLVAVEGILGIILAGFFVNAAIQQRS